MTTRKPKPPLDPYTLRYVARELRVSAKGYRAMSLGAQGHDPRIRFEAIAENLDVKARRFEHEARAAVRREKP